MKEKRYLLFLFLFFLIIFFLLRVLWPWPKKPEMLPFAPPGFSPFGMLFTKEILGLSNPSSEGGFYSLRVPAKWSEIEPQKGQFNFQNLDEIVQFAKDKQLDLLVTLRANASWAINCSQTGGISKQPSCLPKEMADYQQFVQKLVQRYPQVKFWQIENEWHSPNFWQGTKEELVELLKAGYQTIKEENPQAKVILGGISSTMLGYFIYCPQNPSDPQCQDPAGSQMAQVTLHVLEKAKDYYEIVDLHLYHDYHKIGEKIAWIRNKMGQVGKTNYLLWCTEAGGPDTRTTPYSEKTQAEEIVKRHVLSTTQGIEKVFWYLYQDVNQDFWWAKMGLLDTSGAKKPAFYTYKLASQRLNGYLGVEKLDFWSEVAAYAYNFAERKVYVLWSEGGEKEIEFPIETTLALKTKIIIQRGQTTPVEEQLSAPQGRLTLKLDSTPFFLQIAGAWSPPPSVSPSVSPSVPPGLTLNFKTLLEGLPEDKQNLAVTLRTNDWQKQVIFAPDGSYQNLDLTGLETTASYDFVFSAHSFLTIKKALNLASLPDFFDLGTLKTGDLNSDDQVNTLDWSLMKGNFGQSGSGFGGPGPSPSPSSTASPLTIVTPEICRRGGGVWGDCWAVFNMEQCCFNECQESCDYRRQPGGIFCPLYCNDIGCFCGADSCWDDDTQSCQPI